MPEPYDGSEPRLTPIVKGWAARGNGWAVHAPTKEEAIRKYRETEMQLREIETRPYWYERARRITEGEGQPEGQAT